MRKYLFIARAEWIDAIQNWGEIIIWILVEVVQIFVMASLFSANQDITSASGLNPNSLISYFLGVFIVSRLTAFYFDEFLQDQIRDGSFSRFLLKPLSFPFSYIPQNIGGKLFHFPLVLFPTVSICWFFFGSKVLISESFSITYFILSLVISYLIQFSLSVIVSATAFWFEQAKAIIHLKWMLEFTIGGYGIPLVLYPDSLQNIFNLLPFKFLYYIPSLILSGVARPDLSHTLIQGAVWSVVLLFASVSLWRLGIRRYSAVSG